MSENLGKELPANAFDFLSYSNKTRKNSAVFLLTVDEGSYPHVALLSPYQVVAVSSSKIIFAIHSNSRSCNYALEKRKATLILQLRPAVQYIRCDLEIIAENVFTIGSQYESVFSTSSFDVLEDYSEKAPFVSELQFDETYTHEPYSEEFTKLKSLAKKLNV